MIPYGRQNIGPDDLAAVAETLSSEWLTTGPKVKEFEDAVCEYVNANYAVAVSSGTAALHAAMFAIGVKPGVEVIIPAITFAATANCIIYQGGKPVCCDIRPDTLLIDTDKIEGLITDKTKAVIAMDYAGLPCDYQALRKITDKYGLYLISDACHSFGAEALSADIACYSFHPVKHITTGEGGMGVTNSKCFADKMRRFRSHGMEDGEMISIGYNYRITDFQCALGISQLKKLDGWISERRVIAKEYDKHLKVEKLAPGKNHVYHLYVVKLKDRDKAKEDLRAKGIITQIHYKPIYYHPYLSPYKTDCPEAERVYREILSIPIYPGLIRARYIIKSMEGLE